MYEVFLTALVEENDFGAACAVLGGLCGMSPWESVHRVLYFQGPPRPVGISNQSSIDKPIRKDVGLLWKDLHQNLARQSFVLQARYEILKDRDMSVNAPATDLDATPGMCAGQTFQIRLMVDLFLPQRKKVELWEQKKLPSVMRDNQHIFKTETIEEVYRFFREDIEFCLKRWFLQVKANVLQHNKPDEIRKVQDQLLAIRGELEGVFDFKTIDRKVHDTRVAQQQQGIQALPQKGNARQKLEGVGRVHETDIAASWQGVAYSKSPTTPDPPTGPSGDLYLTPDDEVHLRRTS